MCSSLQLPWQYQRMPLTQPPIQRMRRILRLWCHHWSWTLWSWWLLRFQLPGRPWVRRRRSFRIPSSGSWGRFQCTCLRSTQRRPYPSGIWLVRHSISSRQLLVQQDFQHLGFRLSRHSGQGLLHSMKQYLLTQPQLGPRCFPSGPTSAWLKY